MTFADEVSTLAGVGPKRAAAFRGLGIETVGDLLWHLPSRYDDRRKAASIDRLGELPTGEKAVVVGTIASVSVRRAHGRRLYIAAAQVEDSSGSCSAVFFGGAHSFGKLSVGAGIVLWGAPTFKRGGEAEFSSPEYWTFARGEVPSEALALAPIYPACAGAARSYIAKLISAAVGAISHEEPDIPSSIRKKRSIPDLRKTFELVHSPSSPEEAEAGRRALAYRELFDEQIAARRAAAQRERSKAPDLSSGRSIADRYADLLPFALTDAQRNATREIADDLSSVRPMRRMLQGDVGSGKSAVAAFAAAHCAGAGHQAAVMVPTAILSSQFSKFCEKYLAPLGLRCAELRGGAPKAERSQLIDRLSSGEIDVVVGTHALLEEDVVFRSLGLVIVDEQHRFGVRQREALISRGPSPHVLMMSATPIPRTLSMVLYGDLDISVMKGRPPGRTPVVTKIASDRYARELYAFISERASKGERAYWVCPAIDDDGASVISRAEDMREHARDLSVGTLFGSMSGDEKRGAIEDFSSGKTSVLVSTTVVEVGVDVPEATIMVVEGASRFGLSTLHQLRGRVGRGSRRAACFLLDSASRLRANERLRVLTETDDGFAIAEEDLRQRGAGDSSGVMQHGFVSYRAADLFRDADLVEAARDDAAGYEDISVV